MPISSSSDIRVERWPSERPLFALVLIVSAALWLLAVITVVGVVYGAMLGLFFFVMHMAFVAHVRGNGVRIGPGQFPEVHEAVERLARRIEMTTVPEAYLIQGGGMLNAMATRFIGSDILVLYTDLLEACGDDKAALDMIIAHELGHIACGHVRRNVVIAPAMFVPFLFGALSRAREYTCDRYGRAGAGSAEGAVLGKTILAAGGRLARRIDHRHFMSQHSALDTGWMTLGEWLSTHPPLVKRIAQMDPSLRHPSFESKAGTVRALGIVGAALMPVFVAGVAAAMLFPAWVARNTPSRATGDVTTSTYRAPSAEVGTRQVQQDFVLLASFIREEEQSSRGMPWARANCTFAGTRRIQADKSRTTRLTTPGTGSNNAEANSSSGASVRTKSGRPTTTSATTPALWALLQSPAGGPLSDPRRSLRHCPAVLNTY